MTAAQSTPPHRGMPDGDWRELAVQSSIIKVAAALQAYFMRSGSTGSYRRRPRFATAVALAAALARTFGNTQAVFRDTRFN
jgi:hypothetical protein